jgi:Clr5 domain
MHCIYSTSRTQESYPKLFPSSYILGSPPFQRITTGFVGITVTSAILSHRDMGAAFLVPGPVMGATLTHELDADFLPWSSSFEYGGMLDYGLHREYPDTHTIDVLNDHDMFGFDCGPPPSQIPPKTESGSVPLTSSVSYGASLSPEHAKWPGRDDWNRHRAKITRLYRDENRKLADVIAIMRADHGLEATYAT